MKTPSVKSTDADQKWLLVDVEGQPVGRVATQIATFLRGKHKASFTPHNDTGDFVIVINADKVVLTGNKWADKNYYRHSNHPGGLTTTSAQEMLKKHPERIIEFAVRGMMPKTRLGRAQLKKLKTYVGAEHPHEAQQPQTVEL